MIQTPLCDRLGIEHPIVLGGMGSGTISELVCAVSEAGGLGTLGMNARMVEVAAPLMAKVRQGTGKPFGVNFLLFNLDEDQSRILPQHQQPLFHMKRAGRGMARMFPICPVAWPWANPSATSRL